MHRATLTWDGNSYFYKDEKAQCILVRILVDLVDWSLAAFRVLNVFKQLCSPTIYLVEMVLPISFDHKGTNEWVPDYACEMLMDPNGE